MQHVGRLGAAGSERAPGLEQGLAQSRPRGREQGLDQRPAEGALVGGQGQAGGGQHRRRAPARLPEQALRQRFLLRVGEQPGQAGHLQGDGQAPPAAQRGRVGRGKELVPAPQPQTPMSEIGDQAVALPEAAAQLLARLLRPGRRGVQVPPHGGREELQEGARLGLEQRVLPVRHGQDGGGPLPPPPFVRQHFLHVSPHLGGAARRQASQGQVGQSVPVQQGEGQVAAGLAPVAGGDQVDRQEVGLRVRQVAARVVAGVAHQQQEARGLAPVLGGVLQQAADGLRLGQPAVELVVDRLQRQGQDAQPAPGPVGEQGLEGVEQVLRAQRQVSGLQGFVAQVWLRPGGLDL